MVAALSAAYGVYVLLLRAAISVAIFLSVAVSFDKTYKTFKYLVYKAKERALGRTPLDAFTARPLPDPSSYSLVYPKVRRERERERRGE